MKSNKVLLALILGREMLRGVWYKSAVTGQLREVTVQVKKSVKPGDRRKSRFSSNREVRQV